MNRLTTYENSLWLYADEFSLRHDAIQAASIACFTDPQVWQHHKNFRKALAANPTFASVGEVPASELFATLMFGTTL